VFVPYAAAPAVYLRRYVSLEERLPRSGKNRRRVADVFPETGFDKKKRPA